MFIVTVEDLMEALSKKDKRAKVCVQVPSGKTGEVEITDVRPSNRGDSGKFDVKIVAG